jgi:hypothetical protein
MPAFVPAALGTAVVLSALGAVVLCVLVALYGFTPSSEDAPEGATRRLLVTRVGHAVAAACFTATAILIAIVLARPAPAPVPAAAPLTVPDARVPEIGERVAGQETRLTATEARIRELEDALRRRDAERPPPADEQPAPPPRSRAASASPRSGPAPPPVPAPAARAASELPALDAPQPAPRRPEPPAAVVAPSPAGTTPAPAPAVTVTPPPRLAPAEAAPVPPASRSGARRGFDLPNKLREDWREIQRGVDSAGDDFRGAVDDLRRRLLGN